MRIFPCPQQLFSISNIKVGQEMTEYMEYQVFDHLFKAKNPKLIKKEVPLAIWIAV